jgi:hypothetical protein
VDGAEVFVDFVGAVGADGAIVAAGVVALVTAGSGVVALVAGDVVSTGTAFASVTFAANSA